VTLAVCNFQVSRQTYLKVVVNRRYIFELHRRHHGTFDRQLTEESELAIPPL